ncbi:MAG: hypothetical protein LBG60_03670, partial [Bifidobacteriaceae bacterium]|nr:hypothetical protein [Bifidobacteriaceae bacterium]
MSSSSVGRARKSARNQRIWSLATAAAAVAVVLAVGHLASGPVTPAEAGNPRAAAPAVQPAAAPEVIAKSALIEPGQRKNRRSRVAGISIVQGELYLWGWGICGAKGYKTEDWCAGEYVKFRQDNQAPYKVEGLPRGAITEVTAQKYNFNALDTAGYVWGWGSISSVDGTGGSEQERNTTGSNKNQKHGIGYGASYPPKRLRIGAAWDNSCRQVGKSTIITNCNRPYLGEGDPVEILSSTEFSGAAVTKAGLIYSWGGKGWGGVAEGSETVAGHTDGSNRYGAIQVQGLPDPTIEGNRPIQLLGGYQTYWVLLENGFQEKINSEFYGLWLYKHGTRLGAAACKTTF